MSVVASLSLLASYPVWAHRPYDSTDADVAEDDELEVEIGLTEADFDGESTEGTHAVFNLGIDRGREIIIEGAWLRRRSSSGRTKSSIEDAGVFLKQIYRRGSLQGETGISLASECGALIPTRGEERVGGECLLVASHEVSALAIHIDVGFAYEKDHRWSRSLGLIVEGAGRRRFRPGIEVVDERSEGGQSELSVLTGMMWRATDVCAFDVAYRRGLRPSSEPREWRVGLTWTH